jgi:hypothetical protein
MKVYINKHEVAIFQGARVIDAILSYSRRSYHQVKNGTLRVVDCFGNRTEPDGPVRDGQEFSLKKIL